MSPVQIAFAVIICAEVVAFVLGLKWMITGRLGPRHRRRH